ncbi:hypothetical protein CH330_05125 [candidate division WOR-3 bacterium JGI_Cruoil_03_51_56]|uniref:Uncharacterized protein n=1 Tax=candidate division WOR-3 bacterium JGI_Cruoil_03_51_56 TaxID=1973747 RepID=A0A235BTR9_UNCW3|nr:MAG: hypothetical protein CH330_05125 [candidate division WOR-3 bacterium JGI_Cruoil_03_51_56]
MVSYRAVNKPIAVALLSGGLDSVLAIRLILDQGILVTGVNFSGGYLPVQHEGKDPAERAADQLGIPLVRLPIGQEFVEFVKAPRYGRGRNMNPCIDCHILMVKQAWEYGTKHKARFIITGEVLGQRPMSQNKQSLMLVAKRSGTEGSLLRPLSAKLLEPTVPEKTGLVNRKRLLDIRGRSRKRQIELARKYNVTEFAEPAGGCLLTDAGFARRIKEAFEHNESSVEMVELLRFGRHFRLPSGGKVIVGRNKTENLELQNRAPPGSILIDGTHLPGPVALLIPGRKRDRVMAARLCGRYSDRRNEPEVKLKISDIGKFQTRPSEIEVKPANPDESISLVIS